MSHANVLMLLIIARALLKADTMINAWINSMLKAQKHSKYIN